MEQTQTIPDDLREALAVPGAWDRVRSILSAPLSDTITVPADALSWLRPLSYGPREVLSVLVLNRKSVVLEASVIATGGTGYCIIDPAEIARAILKHPRGYSVIIAHNHPTGDTTPSIQDVTVTRKVAAALELLGLQLLDHIVLADDGSWTSIRASNTF